MAKDLPFFKFFVSEWNDGDVTLEDFETQGLFINLCAYYWSNECYITLTKTKKKFRLCDEKCFNSLIDANIIKVDNDVIIINFLDEQKDERASESVRKSNGGKASAEARRLKKLAESEQNANKDSTDIQHVLDSCSTESQVLREEERREEKKRKDIPAFSDFLAHAKDKKNNVLEESVKAKYDSWIENDWKNGNDKPIKNWKSTLTNTVQYLKVDSLVKVKAQVDKSMVRYQWKHDQTVRTTPKEGAKEFFESNSQGGYIAIILDK